MQEFIVALIVLASLLFGLHRIFHSSIHQVLIGWLSLVAKDRQSWMSDYAKSLIGLLMTPSTSKPCGQCSGCGACPSTATSDLQASKTLALIPIANITTTE